MYVCNVSVSVVCNSQRKSVSLVRACIRSSAAVFSGSGLSVDGKVDCHGLTVFIQAFIFLITSP